MEFLNRRPTSEKQRQAITTFVNAIEDHYQATGELPFKSGDPACGDCNAVIQIERYDEGVYGMGIGHNETCPYWAKVGEGKGAGDA